MAEANEKAAELKKSQQKTVELEVEVVRLTGLVTSADVDKQKALAVMKDKYLRELAKLEGKKNAEVSACEATHATNPARSGNNVWTVRSGTGVPSLQCVPPVVFIPCIRCSGFQSRNNAVAPLISATLENTKRKRFRCRTPSICRVKMIACDVHCMVMINIGYRFASHRMTLSIVVAWPKVLCASGFGAC